MKIEKTGKYGQRMLACTECKFALTPSDFKEPRLFEIVWNCALWMPGSIDAV